MDEILSYLFRIAISAGCGVIGGLLVAGALVLHHRARVKREIERVKAQTEAIREVRMELQKRRLG